MKWVAICENESGTELEVIQTRINLEKFSKITIEQYKNEYLVCAYGPQTNDDNMEEHYIISNFNTLVDAQLFLEDITE